MPQKTRIFLLFFMIFTFVFISCGGPQRTLSGEKQTDSLGEDSGGDSSQKDTNSKVVIFSQIKPLFEQRCQSCHGNPLLPVAQFPQIDWTNYSVAKEYTNNGSPEHRGKLVERVWELRNDDAKRMPLGAIEMMSEEERLLVKAWAEGGALE